MKNATSFQRFLMSLVFDVALWGVLVAGLYLALPYIDIVAKVTICTMSAVFCAAAVGYLGALPTTNEFDAVHQGIASTPLYQRKYQMLSTIAEVLFIAANGYVVLAAFYATSAVVLMCAVGHVWATGKARALN